MKITKKIAKEIVGILRTTYPDATCSLNFSTPFEAVVAVALSAQCTDERVNKTTPALFARCKTIQDFVDIDIKELETLIRPCGFYRNKAANIKACAKKVLEEFNGEVPSTMEELLTLPGVGRKTANVVLLEVFGIANGIAVDTHAKRISNKLGLSTNSNPEKIEQDLLKIFDKEDLKYINHLLVWHGRNYCKAQKPDCVNCTLNKLCKHFLSQNKNIL